MLVFEKAFDSVEWNFITETLKIFGFGNSIIKWFKTFYTNISSTILNNGHFTNFFDIKRGVRQGDPLSPYIFILTVELLSAALKFNPNIKGITINDSDFLLCQYADDTTLMLSDSKDNLDAALTCIDSFSSCSGLKANFIKTQALWIGVKRGCGEEYNTKHKICWNHTGKFKLLGILYDLTQNNICEINFEEKTKSFKKY